MSDDTSLPIILPLGQGTVISITSLGEFTEPTPGKPSKLPIEYEFVERGQLTHRQISGRAARVVRMALVRLIAERDPEAAAKFATQNARDQAWYQREVMPPVTHAESMDKATHTLEVSTSPRRPRRAARA